MYCATTGTFLQRDPLGQSGNAELLYTDEYVTSELRNRASNSHGRFGDDSQGHSFGEPRGTDTNQILDRLDRARLNLYFYGDPNPLSGSDPYGLLFGWGYGKYCGFSRRASCPPGSGPPPDDALDAACEAHDCCQATILSCNPYHIVKCSIQLCSDADFAYYAGCAQSYPYDKVKRDACKKAAAEVSAIFCSIWPDWGNNWTGSHLWKQ